MKRTRPVSGVWEYFTLNPANQRLILNITVVVSMSLEVREEVPRFSGAIYVIIIQPKTGNRRKKENEDEENRRKIYNLSQPKQQTLIEF